MAIRMMTSWKPGEPLPANVEIEPFYAGHEAGVVRHSRKCPHYSEFPGGEEPRANGPRADCLSSWEAASPESPCSGPCEPLYMATTHVGLVLDAEGEVNGYDDSDFYAVVWNPEKGEPERVYFASTRGWTYPNGAWADATPEVRAAYAAWVKREEEARRAAAADRAARTPARGKTLRVVKGRKVARGTIGECVWYGLGRSYGHGRGPMRVGIRLASGEVVWTAAANVVVVLPGEEAAPAAPSPKKAA